MAFAKKGSRRNFLLAHIIIALGLIAWEYLDPSINELNFMDRDVLFIDEFASVGLGLVLMHVLMVYVIDSYRSERTKLLEAKDEILDQKQQLENLNKQKDKLHKIMRHDLRGSIAVLQSLSDIMASGDLDTKEHGTVLTFNFLSNRRIETSYLD